MNKYAQDKRDFRGRTPNLIYNVIFFFSWNSAFAYYLTGLCSIQTAI